MLKFKVKSCDHLDAVGDSRRESADVCAECVKTGDEWVHLRTCQSCGVTLCCESSKNKHAAAHFEDTSHPVVASAEAGENWLFCYEDRLYRK
jgi:uncharacterized UBP type Zn finger protein